MSRRRWSLAGLCLVALGCDPMPSLETMQGQVSHGAEYCNWTPIASDSAALFDLAAGLEVKEGVGVSLSVLGYWNDPDSAVLKQLQGTVTVTSDTADVVDVFSAPSNGVALLARKPGKATLTFIIAGHPGSFDAPITVTPADAFVNVEETPLPGEGGAGGQTGGEGGQGGGA